MIYIFASFLALLCAFMTQVLYKTLSVAVNDEKEMTAFLKELKALKWKDLVNKKGIIFFATTFALSLLINNGLAYLLDFNVTTVIYMLCVPLFITAAVIDFKQQLIPDMVDIFLGILGLINLLFNLGNCLYLTLGAIFGGLAFLVLAFVAKIVYKKEGMGLGDVKIMAAIGLIVGLKSIVTISLFSFFIAAAYAIVLLIFKAKSLQEYIAFGPFIVIASILVMMFGADVFIQAFLSMCGALGNLMFEGMNKLVN